MIQVSTVAATEKVSSSKRNKAVFLIGLIGVLAVGGVFAGLTAKALWVRSVTSSVFNKYVIDHNVGKAEISDDASGFQGDFCVLHLNQPIPQAQLQQETLDLMHHYQDLDGGRILSIQYNVPNSSKKVIESDAVYDPTTKIVSMTLNEGGQKVVKQKVDWSDQGDAS
jgi:hypothetical protein